MGRIVISVRATNADRLVDLEVPTELRAADLVTRLADSLGAPPGPGPLVLHALALGRALGPNETLADAGLWDGAALLLARAADQPAGLPPVLAQAPLPGSTGVPAPPVWDLSPTAPARRPPLLLAGGAVAVLLLLAGVGAWFVWLRESPAPVAGSAPTVVPTPELVVARATTSPPVAEASLRPASTVSSDDAAWRDLQPPLDAVWGTDWPSAIALLQSFHTQYPTRTAATDKLYAALIEYGRALHDAGANGAAVDIFDQAVRLAPRRFEARTELASLTPAPVVVEQPAPAIAPPPVAQPAPIPRPTSAPVAPAQAPAPAPPAPVAAEPVPADPSACDVQNLDLACPLADGARLTDTVAVSSGRHYYWFGVPAPAMRLHVQVTGDAGLFVFSDESADPTAPIAGVNASDTGTTILDQVMPTMGAFLLEVVPADPSTDMEYGLAFGLQPVPPPVVVVVADEPPAPPTPTPVPLVAVPPVAARSASTAADRLRQVGLTPRLQTGDRFSAGGAGTVAVQEPAAGASVPAGSTITLTIATGNVVVPAAVGLFEQDASNALRDASVQADIRHMRRSGVDAGRVADLSPPGGSIVPSGTIVVVTISQGE